VIDMAVNKKTSELLHELDRMDDREDDILDVLLRRGARLEEAELRSHQVSVGDLQALTGALASLETAIGAAIANAAKSNGSGPPASIGALAASLREQDAATDRLRAQLRERLLALAPEPAEAPERTLRVADPRMSGADVKAFQRVLNKRLDAWGSHDRIAENGSYGPETRKAARMVAHRLGVAAADYEHGFTPELRQLIRTPSRRTPEQIRRARRLRERAHEPHHSKHEAAHAPATPKPRRSALAAAIHAAGGRYGELVVHEAKRSGLSVSLVCAVLEQETHFRNVFGHDKVRNPIKSPPKGLLEVTEERYKEYLKHRHRGEGAQGVGPMQLTSPSLQDRADKLGGCWKPAANIRVGCEYLAERIKARGLHAGVQAYNGAPGDDYAKSVFALQAKWKARLADARDAAPAAAKPGPKPGARTFKVRHPEMKGPDIKAFQRDLNHRLDAWGIHTDIDEDGEYGTETAEAARKVAYGLGVAVADYEHGFGPELRSLIRTPSRRTPQQLQRARRRVEWRRKLRKQDAKARRGGALRLRAYAEAKKLVGTMEVGGNNRGKTVLEIIRANGGKGPEAWCGDFVAWCYRKAGSKSVNRNWAGVALYLPMTGLSRTSAPHKGDLVRYTFSHIGIVNHFCDAHGNELPQSRATHIKTIEGNTGRSGAVSDSTTGGDGVYMKIRPRNLVKDYIHVSR
jgi:hypothetical protein